MSFTVVQKVIGADGTATQTNSFSVTVSSMTAGNAVMGTIEYSRSSIATISSVHDNAGTQNTFTVKNHSFDSTNTNGVLMFEKANITGGGTSITVLFTTSDVSYCRVEMQEVSGVSAFDTSVAQIQVGPGTTSSSGNITPSGSGEYLYGSVANTSGGNAVNYTVGSGYTLENNGGSGVADAMADEQQTDAAAVAIAATFGNNRGTDSYYTGVMAFTASGGGGGATQIPYDPWPQLGPVLAQ